jgi:hypothetical protein
MTRPRYPPGAAVAERRFYGVVRGPLVEVMEPYRSTLTGKETVDTVWVREVRHNVIVAIPSDAADLHPLTPRARELLRIARRGE